MIEYSQIYEDETCIIDWEKLWVRQYLPYEFKDKQLTHNELSIIFYFDKEVKNNQQDIESLRRKIAHL